MSQPRAGLTIDQVQALIDAALTGKGVIGFASFDASSHSVDGLVTTGIISSVEYLGNGNYRLNLAAELPDANVGVHGIANAPSLFAADLSNLARIDVTVTNDGGIAADRSYVQFTILK